MSFSHYGGRYPSQLVYDATTQLCKYLFFLNRIQRLAEKSSKKASELRRIQEELKLRNPPTPPPTKVTLDESVNLSIPSAAPRPPTPPPITPTPTTPQPPEPTRPATPLEQTLLDLLSERDLGSTGFVTANELSAVLIQLSETNGNPVSIINYENSLPFVIIHKNASSVPSPPPSPTVYTVDL